jgi:hypothetical protein
VAEVGHFPVVIAVVFVGIDEGDIDWQIYALGTATVGLKVKLERAGTR